MSSHSVKVTHRTFMLLWGIQILEMEKSGRVTTLGDTIEKALVAKYPKKKFPNLYLSSAWEEK